MNQGSNIKHIEIVALSESLSQIQQAELLMITLLGLFFLSNNKEASQNKQCS